MTGQVVNVVVVATSTLFGRRCYNEDIRLWVRGARE
jgi:hypothetical protein